MSSFFTIPASQRKRKRNDGLSEPSGKKISRSTGLSTKPPSAKPTQTRRDESISGSESDDNVANQEGKVEEESGEDSEVGYEDDTGAERRLRLAERYLENLKGEVDEVGFDAAEVDRDLIAERLKEDVAEVKGRLYRRITSKLDFTRATHCLFRADTLCTTSIATCPPYAYTVSKDLTLIKWEIPTPSLSPRANTKLSKKSPPPARIRPKKLIYTRGHAGKANDPKYQHHTSNILAVAASSDGRFVATGGADKRLIIWSTNDLSPLRVFNQHRDAITSLAFRRGTNQLYSSSKDRTIKTWSLNELAYVETLFGHQDEVLDVATLAQERCLSVGARDRTVRLWKVVEETQLVFRGGGGDKRPRNQTKDTPTNSAFAEGSIDRVAMVDEEMFVTGSDNGSLSLWTMHKKKPVFTIPVAHGLDPALKPEEASAEEFPNPTVPSPPQPRWITALATIPYSDLIISGSWDGWIRVWKVSEDKRRIESVGTVGGKVKAGMTAPESMIDTDVVAGNDVIEEQEHLVKGVINDISVFERGDRGKDGLCITAAVGKEHRLGRWKKVKGKNSAVVFEVGRGKVALLPDAEVKFGPKD